MNLAGSTRKFPLRVRNACVSCNKKRIRCDGSNPCSPCESRKIDCIYLTEGNHNRKRETSLDGRKSKSSTAELEGSPASAKRPNLAGSRSNSYSYPVESAAVPNYGYAQPLPSPSFFSPLALDPSSFPLPFQQPINLQLPHRAYPFEPSFPYQQPAYSISSPQSTHHRSPAQPANSLPILVEGLAGPPGPKPVVPPTDPSTIIKQPFFRWLGTTAILPPPANSKFVQHEVEIETVAKVATKPKVRRSFGSSAAISFTALSSLSSAFELNNSRDRPTASTSTTRSNSPSSGSGFHASFQLPPRAIIQIFYENMGSFLPFLEREEFETRVDDETISELLFNSMAAISEKICPSGSSNLSELYADRAKSLLVSQLGLPNLSMITSCILLAYHEFGMDRDSGLWAYAGIAIRASTDLGLNLPFDGVQSKFAGDESSPELRSRVFWSVLCLDRLISSGTGRQTSMPFDTIEISLPPPRALFLPTGESLSDPFPYLAKILVILGKATDLINQHCGPHSLPAIDDGQLHRALSPLQRMLNEFYSTLPFDLRFTVHNFKAYVAIHHSQCFLLLSSWFQATYLAVHHSSVIYIKGGQAFPNDAARASATSAAVSISDMLTFADLIQPSSFLSTPFLSQALLMAGCASSTSIRSCNYIDAASARSVAICKDGLSRLTEVWHGVEWIASALLVLDESMESSESPTTTTTSTGKIKSKDRGLINKAKLDDLTRNWLTSAGIASAVGISASGEVDEVSWMDGNFVFRDTFAATSSVDELFSFQPRT